MTWLKKNWHWAGLNLFAVSVLAIVLSKGGRDWNTLYPFDLELESGKWAMRFLLICLTMTPLNTYFGWRGAISLRKPAGLWSFGFAALHVFFYISEAGLTWLAWPMQPFIALGLAGLLVLSVLTITSNRWAMRRLRKYWKRLHRLVYGAGLSVIFHSILAAEASKKILVRDPQAVSELKVYLALLVALLVVRVPLVRRALKHILRLLRPRRKVAPPATPIPLPDNPPEYHPYLNGRQVRVPLDDCRLQTPAEEDVERQQVITN